MMQKDKRVLMTGNEAIALGSYENGVTFAAAYPGTPSTEILENIALYEDIYAEWSPNEKVALESGIGASLAGARTIVSMKHVGVNVAQDPFMTLAYTGVNGGLVLVSADDPGMHSSQNEQDNRNLAPFAKVPMLEPSDSKEAKELIGIALEISEKYDTPILFRITTRIAHSRSIVQKGERKKHTLKPYRKNSQKYCMVPANARKRRLKIQKRIKDLKNYTENFRYNRIEWGKSDNIGVITSGVSYQYVKEALGDDVSILKLTMTYPLPEKTISEFCEEVKKVYIVEELDPYLEKQIKAMGFDVIGKEVIPSIGELSPEIVRNAIGGDKNEQYYRSDKSLPQRPPALCAGCPHRGVFYAIKKLNAVVIGDIGCYSLGLAPPLEVLDSLVCMGTGVSMAHGFKKVYEENNIEDKPIIGVIGDSTFLHSGITGLMNVVYNQSNPTIVILDNRTTAMTGHQPHFAVGENAKGEATPQLQIDRLCKALGIEHVFVVDAYDLEAVEKALKKGVSLKNEPAVIIARRPCVLLKGRKLSGKYTISQDKCTQCKKCLDIGCPAIQIKEDKTIINQTSCVGCSVCAQICPFNAIYKVGEQ